MGRQDADRRWIVAGLILYLLALAGVVLSPISYSDAVSAIDRLLREQFGASGFGAGWIEFVANILMFAPLGFLVTLLLRRHWVGVLVAFVLSAGVEFAQVLIPSRQPSLRDVLANVLGAAIGAGLAWVFVLHHRRGSRSHGTE